ncbi:tyrosine-type recombinase/integrase, partial [Rhodobacteraceae bacterium IMCC15231]|nr:tyrosine-type recombinase/integrase [Rhodobacteraceae bacterium IMCC15231]
MPLKLPRYVFRRANGSFRYKRNVPLHLRALIGKATLYRQLGDSYKEAMQNLPLVHARIEALLEGEKEKSVRDRSIEIIRGALGDEVADMVLANAVPEYSEIEDALNELGKALHKQKLPSEIVEQVYSGKLRQEVITLETALKDYVAYKSDTPKAEKEIKQRVERLRKDMQHIYGKQKLKYVSLSDISRQDANDLRDHLLSRVSANSAVRMLGVVRTAINHAIVEHSLNIPNVFTNLRIKGAGPSKLDRLPLSDTQIVNLEPAYSNDITAWALFVCLRDTGCRVSEIAGLRVKDCDPDKECLIISPTPWRTLKTNNSQRSVPLSSEAIKALDEVSQGKDPEAPLFPQYAKERGGDNCSAMLMKRLRTIITDKKLTMHSLRHRMKDKLRNTGCPEAISMAILGHGSNTVAANYGSGYALDVMREHMEKVW